MRVRVPNGKAKVQRGESGGWLRVSPGGRERESVCVCVCARLCHSVCREMEWLRASSLNDADSLILNEKNGNEKKRKRGKTRTQNRWHSWPCPVRQPSL